MKKIKKETRSVTRQNWLRTTKLRDIGENYTNKHFIQTKYLQQSKLKEL